MDAWGDKVGGGGVSQSMYLVNEGGWLKLDTIEEAPNSCCMVNYGSLGGFLVSFEGFFWIRNSGRP